MIALAVALVIIVASPFPAVLKVLALVPIGFALLMMGLDELLTVLARRRTRRAHHAAVARAYFARLAALPDPEWAQVVESVERRRLRSVEVPGQRRPGAAS